MNILYTTKHPFAEGPDHHAVYFEDPDRIKVELIAPQNHSKGEKSCDLQSYHM